MDKKRKVLIFENSHTLTNNFIKFWSDIASESIKDHNRFVIALSGGRSPTEIYARLSGMKEYELWPKTHVFFADECFLPLEESATNFHMIKQNLLDYVTIPPHNVHAIKTDHENVLIAAEHYKHELVYFFELKEKNIIPRFDFILLGMGVDGDIASLYPQEEGINDPNRITVPITSPHYKTERISLTLPVINNARHIFFVVQGAVKANIVQRIIEGDEQLPASLVAPTDGELVFLLDKEAASKISYKRTYTDHGEAISI